MRRPVAILALLLLVAFPLGCASAGKTTAVCQGGCNQFDCQASVDLLTARAALVAAGQQFGSDPNLKPIINRAFATWNGVDAAWQAYHSVCGQGVSSADVATLAQEIAGILNAAQQLKGGKTP